MKPLSVLIVDDSRAMRRIQREVVSELGELDVLEAEDGVSAIYQLRNADFNVDLILLDWMMPRMDGLTLVRRLKSHEFLKKIPVLMVTSLSDENKIREAWKTGVDGYLLKPFTRDMLLRAILSLSPERSEVVETIEPMEGDEKLNGKSFLERLPAETYSQILELAEMIEVSADTPVLFKGKQVTHFFFVIEGMVEEHQPAHGTTAAIVQTYGKGECFAVTELMSGDRLASNYITSRYSKIARLQKPDFETLLLNFPEINIALSRYLAGKLQKVEMRSIDDEDTLYGSLEVLDLPDLIQAINLRQKTGVIELPGIDSRIEISAGQVVYVRQPDCPPGEGERAFINISSLKPKNFRFLSKPLSGEVNVHMNTTELLFECMRQLDEKGIPL
ncbi:MAG: response regulator [Planctomycetota bacterium]|jgi:two-component system chemotaxis response regulator CheY